MRQLMIDKLIHQIIDKTLSVTDATVSNVAISDSLIFYMLFFCYEHLQKNSTKQIESPFIHATVQRWTPCEI